MTMDNISSWRHSKMQKSIEVGEAPGKTNTAVNAVDNLSSPTSWDRDSAVDAAPQQSVMQATDKN
jgi:hypothetical protein